MKTFLTSGQIALCIGVSVKTVVKWHNKGVLPAVRLPGSTHRRFDIEEVQAFCDEYGLNLNRQHPCLSRQTR